MRVSILLMSAIALATAGPAAGSGRPDPRPVPPPRALVYTMSNATGGNQILAFRVEGNGRLAAAASVATGGLGSGGGLGNQGALALSPSGRRMIAVNAGSDEISLLRVNGTALEVLDVAPSGGRRPVSVALRGRVLYVLNAGGAVGDADNVTGFRVTDDDRIVPIDGSARPLSAAATGPAQVSFSPDGDVLVVTERMTDRIVTFRLDETDVPDGGFVQASEGRTPFGFTFDVRGRLLVSEAFGGDADASALTSYDLTEDGTLTTLDASVATNETAACWAVATPDGRFAYVTNTASGSISGYGLSPDGTLRLLTPNGVISSTGGANSGPIDLALSVDGRLLFDLRRPAGEIGAFFVLPDGRLKPLGAASGLPTSLNGLVAR